MKVLRYAGFKEEEEFNDKNNTEEVDFHIDIASGGLDIPASKNEVVPSGIGKGARKKMPTFSYPEGAIEYAFDVETIGFFLKMALGGYMYNGSNPIADKHDYYGDNSSRPRSFLATLGKDFTEQVFTGCVVDSLELNVNDNTALATVNIVGAGYDRRNIKSEDELNISDEYPIAFSEVNVYINGRGNSISRKVKNLTLSISNNPSTDEGRTVGSLNPTRIVLGDREVSVSLEYFMEDDEELIRYENDEEFELMIEFVKNPIHGALEITIPRAYYDSFPTQPSGRDVITNSVTVNSLVGDVSFINSDGEMQTVTTNIHARVTSKKKEED